MVAAMDPVLMPGRFVFCTVEDGALAAEALATFREEEGLSVLLPVARAEALGLAVESPMRQITLREALAVLRAEPAIELLFTDIGLPGDMNGRALAAAATALRPGLAVLYTTGYTANAIVHHGVLDPGVQFIGKPFSLAALAAKLKAMGYGG